MKNFFLTIIIFLLVLRISAMEIEFNQAKAKVIKPPVDRTIKKGEVLKMTIEKNKAYKIYGYFMSYRFKNNKISGRKFNPSRGTVKFYDTYLKTDELYFYGLEESKIKITEGKMEERIIKEGENFIYNIKSNNNIAAYFYNPFKEIAKIEYDFLKNGESVSEAPLKWRSYELDKGESKRYVWEVNADEVLVKSRKNRVLVKIGHPFEDI